MIKGRYVGTVTLDICVDENKPGSLPFEKMKESVMNDLSGEIKSLLEDEVGDSATVSITQQFADLYIANG